jgi:hypothetical protein
MRKPANPPQLISPRSLPKPRPARKAETVSNSSICFHSSSASTRSGAWPKSRSFPVSSADTQKPPGKSDAIRIQFDSFVVSFGEAFQQIGRFRFFGFLALAGF